MLKFMREKFQYSFPLKIILIAVAASFVGWGIGTGGRGSKNSNVIAEVLDQKITLEEFQRYYNNLVETYRRQLGEQFSPELLERMNVKKGAFDTLTQEKLQLALALKKGIVVSDDELVKEIRSNPIFQRDGVFDQQLYENILRVNRLQPQQFEESMRGQMTRDKLRLLITDSVKVSDLEVRQAYTTDNEKVKVNYITFDSLKYGEKVKPAPAELQKYYQEKKESLKKPESAILKYVRLSPEDFMADVKVTEQEARKYYDDNQKEFKREPKVRARHILLMVAQGAPEPEWEKARGQAEEILKKMKGGADFAKLAKEFSQDPGSKESGGDLGFFSRGQMVRPFDDAAFSLKPGQVSDPVRSPFGYHIIKVEEKQEEAQEPFDSVKGRVLEKLKKSRAKEIAEEKAYNLSYDLTANTFDSVAAQRRLTPQVTEPVFRGRVIGNIPGSFKMSEEALKLKKGEVSNAVEVGGSYYVFTVLEKKDPYIPELKEVEAQVKAAYASEKGRELAEKDAQQAFSKLKAGKTLKQVAGEYQLEVGDSDFFTRTGSPKGVGRQPQFMQEAFQLKPGGRGMVNAGARFYLMELSGKEGINEAQFQGERERFTREFLERKRDLMYRTWLTRSRDRANIKMVGDFTL